MDGLRDTLARYLAAAAVAYSAFRIADLAVPARLPRGLLFAAVDHDPALLIPPEFPYLLAALAILDLPASLALATAPFLLYAAVARAAAPDAPFPHPALARSLRAVLAPVRAWLDACNKAVDRVVGEKTARGAPAALAVGACVAYAAIFIIDLFASSAGLRDLPLDPLYGALYGAIASLPLDDDAHLALFHATDTLTYLAALAATPLLANVIARAAVRMPRGR